MAASNIWESEQELEFYERCIVLEILARSQGKPRQASTHLGRSVRDNDDNEGKPIVHFLDDFALVAAGPGGAGNVAAACLETEEEQMSIRLAKNENFSPAQKQKLRELVGIMNQIMNGGIAPTEGEQQCLDVIANICQTRIVKYVHGSNGLHQLACGCSFVATKFPKYLEVSQPSESRIDTENLGPYNAETHMDYMHLACERWSQIIKTMDQIPGSMEVNLVKSLASQAYEVRHSTSFRRLLSHYCLTRSSNLSKIIEKLGKIARFGRAAATIVQFASSVDHAYTSFCLEFVESCQRQINILSRRTVDHLRLRLPPYSTKMNGFRGEAQRLLRRWKKYVVHAEILLLLFYEENPNKRALQNYIGVSKRSCYLCANLISLHNKFRTEGDHQQLYCLWTLPSVISFSHEEARQNFIQVVDGLCNLVREKQIAACRAGFKFYAYNPESVANFSRQTLLERLHIPGSSVDIAEPPQANSNISDVEHCVAESKCSQLQNVSSPADIATPPKDLLAKEPVSPESNSQPIKARVDVSRHQRPKSAVIYHRRRMKSNQHKTYIVVVPRTRRKSYPLSNTSVGHRNVTGTKIVTRSRTKGVESIRKPAERGLIHQIPQNNRSENGKVTGSNWLPAAFSCLDICQALFRCIAAEEEETSS